MRTNAGYDRNNVFARSILATHMGGSATHLRSPAVEVDRFKLVKWNKDIGI